MLAFGIVLGQSFVDNFSEGMVMWEPPSSDKFFRSSDEDPSGAAPNPRTPSLTVNSTSRQTPF